MRQAEKNAQLDTAQRLIHTQRHKILMKLNHLQQIASSDKMSTKEQHNIKTMLETPLTKLGIFELHEHLKKLIALNNEVDKIISYNQETEVAKSLIGKKLT